jgi:excinuclease ABC subunit C
MIGRQHYYMGNVEGKAETEILGTLLHQYYLETDDVPGEIVLPSQLEDAEALREWLSSRRGAPVSVSVPTEGEEAKIVRLSASNARFLLDDLKIQKMKKADYIPHPVLSLQKDLHLQKPPLTIECFDISNIQGTDAVASMVVFVDGKPKKSLYRKFKIRSVEGPDDFASMREVIGRRYRRLLDEQQAMPDLVMVDGGKGQLSSAVEVLRSLELPGQPIIGLAKRLEEVFVPGESDPLLIPKSSTGLRLLQQIRDEAHRFAITFHRSLRSKRTLQTELDLIEGVGEKRAKELLEAFGSVQGVKFASMEQLAEVVGEKTAEKIQSYFGTDEETDEPSSSGGGEVGGGR